MATNDKSISWIQNWSCIEVVYPVYGSDESYEGVDVIFIKAIV